MRRRRHPLAEAWNLIVLMVTVRMITRHYRAARAQRAAGWR